MAPGACLSLHELEGYCEYCGEVCDSTQDELNAIACTFEGCPSPTIYHQYCIETYLKTIRLDKYVELKLDRTYSYPVNIYAVCISFCCWHGFFLKSSSSLKAAFNIASLVILCISICVFRYSWED